MLSLALGSWPQTTMATSPWPLATAAMALTTELNPILSQVYIEQVRAQYGIYLNETCVARRVMVNPLHPSLGALTYNKPEQFAAYATEKRKRTRKRKRKQQKRGQAEGEGEGEEKDEAEAGGEAEAEARGEGE